MKFELISFYSVFTVSLGISSVAEEGCLELPFYVVTKISLCRENFFALVYTALQGRAGMPREKAVLVRVSWGGRVSANGKFQSCS